MDLFSHIVSRWFLFLTHGHFGCWWPTRLYLDIVIYGGMITVLLYYIFRINIRSF